MTHHLPLQRPTATDLENHPFFWQSAKVLNFLQDVSDAIEGLQDIDHSGTCAEAIFENRIVICCRNLWRRVALCVFGRRLTT